MLMIPDDSRLEDTIVPMLLEMYAERTTLPVAFFSYATKSFHWSANGVYSPLCKLLNPDLPGATNVSCTEDHTKRCFSATGTPEVCHAGLWNVALPIEVDGEVVGVLISGQRRLRNSSKDDYSRSVLDTLVDSTPMSEREAVRRAFEQTLEIHQDDFDTHLLVRLKSIQEYLYRGIRFTQPGTSCCGYGCDLSLLLSYRQ
jgi:ligand-binding sensor protein